MIKLYDLDAYMNEFTAKVISCDKNEDGNYRVILDRTAFFPTAGGQTCDTGVIDDQTVSDVIIENEIIIHILENPIPLGETVSCKIDWDVRFRKMQHHSAEHIVSVSIPRSRRIYATATGWLIYGSPDSLFWS